MSEYVLHQVEQTLELKDILTEMKQIIIKDEDVCNKNVSDENINEYYCDEEC